MNHLVIAIDGPSGSGKSSTARACASRLGLAYLDTGAMYRAVASEALYRGTDFDDEQALTDLALAADLRISTDAEAMRVAVNGRDATAAVREQQVSRVVSKVARIPAVREHLIKQMRDIIAASGHRIVLEGRDTTTVVAPDAEVRVLLVADPQERVRRREAELGLARHDDVSHQVLGRDAADAKTVNFTDAAPGVQVIDSTHLTLDQVVSRIVRLSEQPCACAVQDGADDNRQAQPGSN